MTSITKSIRLTESLRGEIIAVLMKGKFVKETDALYAESAKIADAAYVRFFADEADTLRKMKTLPGGWLPELDAIKVKFGGSDSQTVKLHFNGYSRFLPWRYFADGEAKPSEEKRIFRQIDIYLSPQLALSKTDPLSKRYFALVLASEKLAKDRKALDVELKCVLGAVNTTAKLIAMWPEVADTVASLLPSEATPIKNLPAKTLRDLTAKLGLAAS